MSQINGRDARAILGDVKRLAIEYYNLTGRPLGATGEIAEFEAADKLGLDLAIARTAGYDATGLRNGQTIKFQIKGRRVNPHGRYIGRVGAIKLIEPFDAVLLVLLDERYDALEIWEASRAEVAARLSAPGSKSRNERGSMGISQFRSIAEKVWPK